MKYEIELNDEDVKCMAHYVIDPKRWIDDAIKNKIAACQKRILKKCIEESIDKDKELPRSKSAILNQFFGDKDYKCRRERELPVELKENNGESPKASI